tara:strand:- start:412 stop:807 length:396 start_codon:yes stop_codon:yes gene_type:complete
MKYLNDYIKESTATAQKKNGVFFAVSNKQFDEQANKDIKYVQLYGNLICPKDNVKQWLQDFEKCVDNGIKQDIKENSVKGIIKRELSNHEYQYTMDLSYTIDALENYPITKDEIKEQAKLYMDYCIENDLI